MDATYLKRQFSNFKKQIIDDYPAYAKTEMENVLADLQEYYDIDNPIVIGFSTDQHVNSPTKEKEIIPQLRTMRDLTKLFPFNICVLGGDSNNYITQFTVPDNSNIAYMRISANGVNADAIITVNESLN